MLRRWEDLEAKPWKNGGGSTRDVAASPEGATLADFDWRVSVAEVERDGPFSAFPDIDRVIMLLEGGEMVLTVNGTPHTLGRLDTLAFAGEDDTACRVPGGATRDLNLMTRRGRAAGSMRVVEVAGDHEVAVSGGEGGAVVLLALTGGLALEPADGSEPVTTLRALDSVVEGAVGSHIRVAGTGTLVELRITVAPHG
ncbi:HutD family protein [Actinospica sp. MGRD01-02]|uniref:HutD family protein n=1 Tax=Actinospica acidithermotolerans TaxID=2828514 RepID=A0A941EAN5_9ACTN|nr:HutD family protein [Actinospica acidithermotolerans]MBR7826998.1 HutD family protein [Actinospica acidithermotolerans]